MKTEVIVSLRIEGVHSWPAAPEEVEFLRHPHRHEFHVKARKEVTHTDREIEIIQLKREIQDYLELSSGDFGYRSCEDIATELCARFDLSYCEVLEDGENGAAVTA